MMSMLMYNNLCLMVIKWCCYNNHQNQLHSLRINIDHSLHNMFVENDQPHLYRSSIKSEMKDCLITRLLLVVQIYTLAHLEFIMR